MAWVRFFWKPELFTRLRSIITNWITNNNKITKKENIKVANISEKAFEFSDNWIQVTIPFNFISVVNYQIEKKVVNKNGEEVVNKLLNKSQLSILGCLF